MKALLALLLLGAAAVPAAADLLPREAVPVAAAVEKVFGASVWSEVKISTNGPLIDLSRLAREGFYKRELIELVLIGASSGKSLKDLAKKRREGATLSAIAADQRLDPIQVRESALAIEAIVNRDYLPRFPERRPRIVKEE